jgi:hypothetical protein
MTGWAGCIRCVCDELVGGLLVIDSAVLESIDGY